MSYTSAGPVPWPVPPDWSSGVRETLAWLTDVLRSNRTGYTQHRQLRLSPRRTFTFDVLAEAQARRVADALLFDRGTKLWALPIWHDVQRLLNPVAVGATIIPCRTTGFEFREGGQAMLWRSVNAFEVVTIDAVLGDSLALLQPLGAAWGGGTRLYPLRAARVVDGSQESAWNDVAGKRSVSFEIAEVCDWPAELPASTYLGFPVLEHRPDEGSDPTASYSRQIEVVDEGSGLPSVFDLAGRAFRSASHRWLMDGRDEHGAVRSLLYGLAGRAVPLWVPSWAADIKVAATIAADSTVLVVEWCGYTLFGRQQAGRRDIRIELKDGTVFYRRITGSGEMGEFESLTIASALGTTIAPSRIRLVSFMSLCTQTSDELEIEHQTDADGIGVCDLSFMAVTDDL
ncbi:TPA: hypothetical protein QEM98_000472 [Stenotrophomonas maltophilia]|nr:hypothetical protein [Stenotrophomonas maltophilia]